MKHLLTVCLLVSGTSPANTSSQNLQDGITPLVVQTAIKSAAHPAKIQTVPRQSVVKLLPKTKRHQVQLLTNQVVDNEEANDIIELDLHIGYRRPDLVHDADTDDVSDYVKNRLAAAREAALARFRQVHNC